MKYPEQVELPLVLTALVLVVIGRIIMDVAQYPIAGLAVCIVGGGLGVSCLADYLVKYDGEDYRE